MENPPEKQVESLSLTAGDLNSTTQMMSFEKKLGIQEEELLNLLTKKPQPICYVGFKPSGRIHIAQGVMKMLINVKRLTSAGCKVKIWIEDWFAIVTNEMDGDLTKIQTFGQYMIEVWKSLGMDLDNVEFLWSSKEIFSRADEYWPLVQDIARQYKTTREDNVFTAAQILYPCMQCADMSFLKADICLLDMDQTKVDVLARGVENKPIIISQHMLRGLLEGQEKMSNSDPSSAIFMDDEEAEVIKKIRKAYCPPKIVKENPCLDYIKYIVFPWFNELKVERKQENGGEKVYTSYKEIVADYEKGELHPADLKPALSKSINRILQPMRDHCKNDDKAMALSKRVKDFKAISTKKKKKNSPEKKAESPPLTAGDLNPTAHMMSIDEKFMLLRSIGEECQEDVELLNLLKRNPQPISYDGFEPSGRMHIAQGVMKAINVNKLTSTGCKVKIWIADWFALLNNKMGGDLSKIQTVGNYLIEIWKALGMDLDNVEFIWASKEINSRAHEYWSLVMDIAQRNKLPRIRRCCQIMGRTEDDLTAAQILYSCMQCADIFFLKADICQLGMDQRKVNMLAREYCEGIKRKNKPIILSHHMLLGLLEGQEKMSKSNPSSAIFMEDEEAEVIEKIENAYCPPNKVDKNPCIEYIKYIVFPKFNQFKVERKQESGGEKVYTSYEELVVDYEKGELLPADLKPALSKTINRMLQPVRDHFKNNEIAKDLSEKVKGFKVTR